MNNQNKNEIAVYKRRLNDEQNLEDMKKLSNSKVMCRGLPAELINEMFACLALENAFGILAKMPNLLLARNVRKMLNSIKMAMKLNKWNLADTGSQMITSQEGLVVKHSGPDEWTICVRANMPIPKLNFNYNSIAYFELEIVEKNTTNWDWGICLGFCTKQFPIEDKFLGKVKNSIGIWSKRGMFIDGSFSKFGKDVNEYFIEVGDIIGIGIVHFQANLPLKCFATSNGKLLGMIELPAKFVDLQFFPAVNLYAIGDSIRGNFGKDKWRFNFSQLK